MVSIRIYAKHNVIEKWNILLNKLGIFTTCKKDIDGEYLCFNLNDYFLEKYSFLNNDTGEIIGVRQ